MMKPNTLKVGRINYDKYEKTIPQDIFESLQKAAKEKLEKEHHAHPVVVEHWKKIIDGEVPFGYIIKED